MALGVLEDKTIGDHVQVPGTTLLRNNLLNSGIEDKHLKLKHAAGNKSIILIPQPSSDGKLFSLEVDLLGIFLRNAGFKDIAAEWGVSVNSVAATNADLAMALGWFTLFQGSLAIKIGRRPVFLFASACQFFTCLPTSTPSKPLESFKDAEGFGMAPYEALATASIGDVFFVHERGTRVAIWSFAIGGMLNRWNSKLGWRWTFWIIMIVFGISFLTSIFLMPETMASYDREPIYDTDSGSTLEELNRSGPVLSETKGELVVSSEAIVEKTYDEDCPGNLKTTSVTSATSHLSNFTSPPKSFTEELRLWSYSSDIGTVKALFRPFPFLLSPAVWFTFFAYGCTTVWLVVVSVIYSLVFGSAPYFFDATKTGLVSIGPFIGSVLGTATAGPLSDWSVKWAAGRNNGIYEPEFRLFLLVPMFVLDIAGYIGWAVMQPKGLPWIGPVIMYSMINAGQCIGSTAVCSYLIDVHQKNAPECFALVNFLKNMVLYVFTLFVNDWVINLGVLSTFGMLAALTAFCILTGIPMYILGKRARSFVSRRPKLFLTN
ncbi:hypothetical protein EW145_g3708 [Phellinidium pouzarii]|uniref:Major facilitator superfamily (MFS) profile domain-containing protein n=1 Tax=Phellinidium pouzarii TaxID=167371 RepID=A0A4S4L655_9AGAM|nr:hypothetical protein EW145_g3708 [Phellinidium pouzarii]